MSEETIPFILEWHTEVWVKGPESEIDVHQKQVEETATLGELDLTVKKAPSNNGAVVARFSVHFQTERAIDAVFMAVGLCSPRTPELEIIEVRAVRHG